MIQDNEQGLYKLHKTNQERKTDIFSNITRHVFPLQKFYAQLLLSYTAVNDIVACEEGAEVKVELPTVSEPEEL